MKATRILIVEDEILIADMLERYLIQKGYEVVGTAISFDQAKDLYLQKKPDLSLIDIRLNGPKTGIDFAQFIRLQEMPTPYIYLTSQLDSLNINKAKETLPVGYLSKPIQKETLFTTIEVGLYNFLFNQQKEETITLSNGNKNFLIKLKDIIYLEASHIYVLIHVATTNYIMQRSSLKEILERLPTKQFLQTHRSFAININRITHWDEKFVYLEEAAVPISRARRKIVQAFCDQ